MVDLIGKEEALFEKSGIQLDERIFDSGKSARDAVLADRLDAAVLGATPFIVGASKGGMVAIATVAYAGKTIAVVAGSHTNIKSIGDLKGKNIGTQVGSSTHNDFETLIAPKYGLKKLVSKVFHAVSQGPLWKETLLVVVYDEHGGFYDHQHPTVTPEDDDQNFREYGPRVPAFIISAWTKPRFVATDCYDHTSLIKTILPRFCRKDDQIPDMGARVNAARHLGSLLSLDAVSCCLT